MRWGKGMAGGMLAGVALMLAGAAQAGVVVKASGPSASQYPVGKKLDDSATITLQKGDSVTVLTSKGTKVISGPGRFTVGVRGESTRSTFVILTRQNASARVRTGAVRSGVNAAAPQNPNLWNVDVTKPGKMCLADSSVVTFWRPDTDVARTYVLRSGKSDYLVQIEFPADEAQAVLGPDKLPLRVNSSYRLSSEEGSAPQPIEFVVLDNVPDAPDELAAELADKGCSTQLTMLSDRLMTSGE
ncbi:hypothetical protein [Qipengyuania sp.]|uniref:hypothetical protein n=1 Tax=Qipengyuania sp. TaxID=2004515 RepID=UPI0035C8357D